MLPDRVSNPGPLTYESGALPIALRGPARVHVDWLPKDRERQLSSMEFSEYIRSLKCVKCTLEI